MSNLIKDTLVQASKKHLSVKRNVIRDGYTVILPSGSHYHAKTDEDLIKFVKDY